MSGFYTLAKVRKTTLMTNNTTKTTYNFYTIPVKPFVAKYILKVYGDCIKVSRRTSTSLLLYHLLQKNESDKQYDHDIKFYTSSVQISISDKFCFRRGARHLSSFSIVQFNTFVEDIFKTDLHRFIDVARLYGSTIENAIENFQKEYNLTDSDLSLDAMKKSYQRYRLDKQKKKVKENP